METKLTRNWLCWMGIVLVFLAESTLWAVEAGKHLDFSALTSGSSEKYGSLERAVSLTANPYSWQSGFIGDFKKGAYTIAALNDGMPSQSLKLNFQPLLLEPLAVQSCDALNTCKDLDVVRNGRKVKVTSEGITWEFRMGDIPCSEGLSCSMEIPTWTLSVLAQSARGGLKNFPKKSVVAQASKGFMIVDSLKDAIWGFFPINEEIGALGFLESAEFGASGRLFLRLSKGLMILDFKKDRVIVVDKSSISLSSTGIAGLDRSSLYKLIDREGSDESLIYADDNIVGWGDGYYVADWNSTTPEDIFQGEMLSHGDAVLTYGYGFDENGTKSSWALSQGVAGLMLSQYSVGKPFEVVKTIQKPGFSVESYTLESADVFATGDGKLFHESDGELIEASLPENNGFSFYSSEKILIEVKHKDTCSWNLYNSVEDTVNKLAFKGDDAGCGQTPSISESLTDFSITMRNGDSIVTYYLQK